MGLMTGGLILAGNDVGDLRGMWVNMY